jgi:CrcB protein
MIEVLLVAAGAAIGAPLRYWLDTRLTRRMIPWGVLVANVVGSFALGLVSGRSGSMAYLLLGTGYAGALTTMSTLAVDTVGLWRGAPRYAVINIALTLVLGIVAAATGVVLA